MKFGEVVRLLEENGYTANYRLIERVGGACAPAHSKPNRPIQNAKRSADIAV